MSEQRGDEEQEVGGDEEQEARGYEEQEVKDNEENAEANPQPGGGTSEQPPEGDREPGGDGAEVQGGGSEATGGFLPADVLEPSEDAGTQADVPEDAEQLREPPKTENVGDSVATVKVVLVPEGHVMTVAFPIGHSIQELKGHLASELRVPAEVLRISVDGGVVEEQQSLMELGVRPHGSTRMEMSSADPTTHPLRPLRPPEHDDMPDVITVRVQTDEGELQEVVVEIERPRQQKAFLGGYRHRLTGVEYHHVAVQTLPKRRPDRGVEVFNFSTQTGQQSQAQQCLATMSTQTTRTGCYVSCMNDKLVTPKPSGYVTADEYHARRLRAVIRLQSFARGWLARQEVDQLKRERDRRIAWLEMVERRRREEKEEQLRDRRRRWLNPQKREDFNLLYQALGKWRHEEEQRINSSLQGAERKAALCSLLEQETQLISAIGCHRIAVQGDNYDRAVRHLLDKSAAPHQWRAADGRLIEMENPQTIRAGELRDLYNDVNQFTVSKEQRLQVLMTLKHTVKEHACQLTQDIVDLIDREVDLMTREVKAANLEGLRKRISTLFLQYVKTPAFNPQVAKLLKVPQSPSQLKNKMFCCRGCRRYLHSADFSTPPTVHLSSRCHDCSSLDNIARSRNDSSCYKNILRSLRVDEQQLNKEAKIPFLLQVEDVRYLVEAIWASRSAISPDSDLYNLVFVRWDRRRDWSPWNCILLSKEESSAHTVVEDVHQVYETTFIRRIEHKHRLARRHFSQLSVMSEYLDSQPTAALGNQLVSWPITMATGKHATDTTPASAH